MTKVDAATLARLQALPAADVVQCLADFAKLDPTFKPIESLFRRGVPDTVITEQFERESITQSYEYDHRSLGELLKFVSLPDAAKRSVRPGSPQDFIARMVVSGSIGDSHLVRSFKKIQAEEGGEVAFAYLAASADGFHVTPYGFCTNSFSLDPCARHLKCFVEGA